jgi:hypothetical protein
MRIQDPFGFICISGHSDLFWAENSNLKEIDPGTANSHKRRTDRCDENFSSKSGRVCGSSESNERTVWRLPGGTRDSMNMAEHANQCEAID